MRYLISAIALVASLLAWTPQPATALTAAASSSIAVGSSHSCVIDTQGDAYCWGSNPNGQLGDGTSINRMVPVLVAGGHKYKSIAVGQFHTCAITTADALYCWGSNGSGQIGSSPADPSVPALVPGGRQFKSITAGRFFTCGVTLGNEALCWGENSQGELGRGFTSVNEASISAVTGSHAFKSISAGSAGQSVCAVTTANAVFCWGLNGNGQLGIGNSVNTHTPTQVSGYTFVSVSVGSSSSCAMNATNDAYCWGNNGQMQLGTGDYVGSNIPLPVIGGHKFTSVVTGDYNACGITTSAQLRCWGSSDEGQLGRGSMTPSGTPVFFGSGSGWVAASSGLSIVCGVTSGGSVLCAGQNAAAGKLGNNSTAASTVPVTVHLWTASNSTSVTGTVNPSFTFSISGRSSACNNATISSGTSATGSAVNLGQLNPSTLRVAAQDLLISSNAASGFTVLARTSGPMASGSSTIDDMGGSYTGPVAFSAPGTEAFGFTTSESALSTGVANRFTNGGPKWAPIGTGNVEVATGPGPLENDLTCVAFQLGVATDTPAGLYTTTVSYTAVPTF